MLRFLMLRLIQAIPVILGVITLTFALTKIAPGDPTDAVLGETASWAEKEAFRRELGLDQPLLHQYLGYVLRVSQLEFGKSYISKRSVTKQLAVRLPATIELSAFAMLGALALGLGLSMAWRFSGLHWLKPLFWLYSVFGLTLPAVILAPSLVWLFAIRLDWFPVSERQGLLSVVLPALSLSIPLGSVIARLSDTSFSEVAKEPFIQSLKAKGLSPVSIQLKHALKKAMLPVVTITGLQTGALLTGTIITETIFDWPGIGTLLYKALSARDFPVIGGCVLVMSLTYVLLNIATDLISAWLNPHFRDQLLSAHRSTGR